MRSAESGVDSGTNRGCVSALARAHVARWPPRVSRGTGRLTMLGPQGRRLAVCFVLANTAVVTGAVSFFARPLKLEASVKVQRAVYEGMATRGGAGGSEDWLVRSHACRVLMPALMGVVADGLGLGWPRAFGLVRLISIMAAYAMLFLYLRQLFTEPVALSGVLLVAATVPITFSNWHELPTDFPDVFFWTLGLLLIRRQSLLLFTAVVFLATLNRETSLLLGTLLCVRCTTGTNQSFRRGWLLAVVLAWALPYFWLKWWTGVPVTGQLPQLRVQPARA